MVSWVHIIFASFIFNWKLCRKLCARKEATAAAAQEKREKKRREENAVPVICLRNVNEPTFLRSKCHVLCTFSLGSSVAAVLVILFSQTMRCSFSVQRLTMCLHGAHQLQIAQCSLIAYHFQPIHFVHCFLRIRQFISFASSIFFSSTVDMMLTVLIIINIQIFYIQCYCIRNIYTKFHCCMWAKFLRMFRFEFAFDSISNISLCTQLPVNNSFVYCPANVWQILSVLSICQAYSNSKIYAFEMNDKQGIKRKKN